MIDLYDTFRPLLVASLLAHLLGLAPQWFRYVGPKFDPGSIISSRLKASLSILVPLLLALVSLVVSLPFLLVPLYLLLWYVHIHRRFESLGRGAGAVGVVPQVLALFVIVADFGRFFAADANQFLYFSSVGFLLFWAGILINSGLVKLQEGYLEGLGIQSFLSNPHWGRFWRYFMKNPIGVGQRKLLGRLALLLEIIGGFALLIPGIGKLAAFLIIGMFLFVGIFIKLYSLPWISILITTYFYALFDAWPSLDIRFSIKAEINLEIAFIIILVGFVAAVGISQIFGAVLVVLELFGVSTRAIFEMRLLRMLLVFRWRVFTYEVISTCVTKHELSLSEDFDIERGFDLARASNPLLAQATESVAITSLFNTLKSREYWHKFPWRLRNYFASTSFQDNAGWLVMWVCLEDFGSSDWHPIIAVSCNNQLVEPIAGGSKLNRVFPENVQAAISNGELAGEGFFPE